MTDDCKHPQKHYSERWDAFYCNDCHEWLQAPCGCKKGEESECYFRCWDRPENAAGEL